MIKRGIIAALCLFFCSALILPSNGFSTPEQTEPSDTLALWHYTEGLKSKLIQGDSVAARHHFEQAIAADSLFAPAYYELASALPEEEQERTLLLAHRAQEIDTTNNWYLQLYGQTLVMGSHYKEALLVYEKLINRDPQNPDNFRLLAMLKEQGGEHAAALALLDSAELRFGKTPPMSQLKRRLLISNHQYERALTEAQAQVTETPYDPNSHVILGEIYNMTGQDSLALVEFNKALAIDSTNLETLISLADYQNRKQNYSAYLTVTRKLFESDELPLAEKVRIFKQFTSDIRFYKEFYPQLNNLALTLMLKYPAERRVVDLYGQHLLITGNTEEALTFYKQHLDDTPPQIDYYTLVIEIESYLQHPDSANRYIHQALSLFPENPQLHLSKAHVLVYQKQYDAATKAYKEALLFAPTDSLRSAIWGYIGDVYQQQGIGTGSVEEAVSTQSSLWKRYIKRCYAAYDQALKQDKNNVSVLNNYAYFLSLEKRDLYRAFEMSSRVIALTDNNPTYLDTHAWVLFQLGRLEEARKVMQQAISLGGQKSADLQVHYGDILAALGEHFMAETYWKRALENGYNADEIARRIATLKQTAP
ncbi:MAG: tetratricopeptide repeat protein [Alistipes sp.]